MSLRAFCLLCSVAIAVSMATGWIPVLFDNATDQRFHWSRTRVSLTGSPSGFGWCSQTEQLWGITRVTSRVLSNETLNAWRGENRFRGYGSGEPPWWSTAARFPSPPVVETIPYDDIQPFVMELASGFPMRCLAYSLQYFRALDEKEVTPNPLPHGTWSGKVLVIPLAIDAVGSEGLAEYLPHSGFLPTRILWPGFLLNTLFWSAVIASPFWLRRGFVAWRSARRRRAGRCPICGYARAGINPHHPCPECGKSATPSTQSTQSHPQPPQALNPKS